MKNQKAFTLVELLTVVVIISILAVIGTSVFTSGQKSTARRKAETYMKLLQAGLENYKADFGEYPVVNGGKNVDKGAQTLYQAMTGDGYSFLKLAEDSDGIKILPRLRPGFDSSDDVEDSNGKLGRYGPIYIDGININDDGVLVDSTGMLNLTESAGVYAFVDPYGDTIKYISDNKVDKSNNITLFNKYTYDLYLRMGDSTSYKDGPGEGWIKNW